MGVYDPHAQVICLFKALIFLTCKQNIIIYSRVRFQLYIRQKVHKLRLCGHFRDFKVTLKLKVTDIKFFTDYEYM